MKISRSQLAGIVDHFWLPLAVVIAVGVLTVGYYLVLNQQYQDFAAKASRELPDLRQRVTTLTQQYEQLSRADREGLFSLQDERLLERVMPGELDVSAVVVQLTTMAQQRNLAVTELTHAPAPEPTLASSTPALQGVGRTLITLRASGGSYDEFKAFVSDLESSVLLFDVQEISFDPAKQSYEIELLTYYYPTT